MRTVSRSEKPMKLAASNIALPAGNHVRLLPELPAIGIGGVEIVPSHTWPGQWNALTRGEVEDYRLAAQRAGLRIVGLHGLLRGRPDLDLFGPPDIRARVADHLVHLLAVCRDLGGRTLVIDSRWRGRLPPRAAWILCRDFLHALLPRIEPHGTRLCFAPLAPDEGDFCATARECATLIQKLWLKFLIWIIPQKIKKFYHL